MVIAKTTLWYFAVSFTFHKGECLICLKGGDLVEPRLSMTVIDCPHAYACSSVSTSSQCVHCCGENLCNNEACGVPGYPLDRGVICYSCPNDPQPENRCHNIDVCKPGEECQVVGRDIFGRTVYTTSCVVKGACGIQSPVTGLFGKRSEVIRSSQSELSRNLRGAKCTVCCNNDLCNRNCGFATSLSPIGYTSASPVVTKPAGQSSCKDSLDTCNLLDKDFYCTGEYFSWAWTNCKSYCGRCNTTTFTIPTTTKVYFGCAYRAIDYNQGDVWMDGCKYNNTPPPDTTDVEIFQSSKRCPEYTNLPPGCTVEKKPGACCGQPTCGIDHVSTIAPTIIVGGIPFCRFRGQSYLQDQTWNDGCSKLCTCTDAIRGTYTIEYLCLNWDNLPGICHLEAPGPGFCCEQPRCPDGVIINIPMA